MDFVGDDWCWGNLEWHRFRNQIKPIEKVQWTSFVWDKDMTPKLSNKCKWGRMRVKLMSCK